MKRVISHQWSVIRGQWSGVSKKLGLITVYCLLITCLTGCASTNPQTAISNLKLQIPPVEYAP
jgi:hypothetical protein